jgi:hypothetical protein
MAAKITLPIRTAAIAGGFPWYSSKISHFGVAVKSAVAGVDHDHLRSIRSQMIT